MSNVYKRWSRELAPLGLNEHRIMNTIGNTKLHDIRLTAAQSKPLYKVFQPRHYSRKYGQDTVNYMHKGFPSDLQHVLHEINERDDNLIYGI